MIEEINVIRDVVGGNADAFRLLVQRYEKPVIRMVRNITSDDCCYEDIAQDVFLAAYAKLPYFDPNRGNFSTWLFTITRNKSINALKKKKPLVVGELPEQCDCRNPSDSVAQKECLEALERKLQMLPPKYKSAFVLAEFEGLPYEQIAQIEGVSLEAVKSRINRAKNKLRLVLKSFEEDDI